jgi:hypothetical protein
MAWYRQLKQRPAEWAIARACALAATEFLAVLLLWPRLGVNFALCLAAGGFIAVAGGAALDAVVKKGRRRRHPDAS